MEWLSDNLGAAMRIARTQLGKVQTFDDGVHPHGIHTVRVHHGWYIDGILVTYRDGSVCNHGNTEGGETTEWIVPDGEHICKVLIRADDFVDQLVFVTNRGNNSPVFGGNGGQQRSEGSSDAMLLGMRGSCGGLVANLKFYWGKPVVVSRGGESVTLGFSELSTECLQCGRNPIATRYKPCGHAVLCEECTPLEVPTLQHVHAGLQTVNEGSRNRGIYKCPVCGVEVAFLEKLAPVSENAVVLEANARRSLEALMFRLPSSHGGGYAIATGAHQFTELWLRDFCRASHGILAAGMLRPSDGSCPDEAVSAVSVVSAVLSTFLGFVSDRPDGLVPRVLDYFPTTSTQEEREKAVWWKVVHGAATLTRQRAGPDDVGNNHCEFPSQAAPRLHAMYRGESGVESTIDSNYLLIRAFARLAEHLDDAALVCFAEEHGQSLRAALGYYAVQSRWMDVEGNPMLLQEPFSEWKDSLLQHGASSFTNLELIEAYESVLLSPRLRPIFSGVALNPQRFGGMSMLSQGEEDAYGIITKALAAWKREVVRIFLRPDVPLLYELYAVDEVLRPKLAVVSHLDAQLQYLTVTSTPPDADIADKVSIDSIMAAFSREDAEAGGRLVQLLGIDADSWPGPEVDAQKSLVGMRQYHGKMMWSWLAGWLAHRAVIAGRRDVAELVFEWLRSGQEARFGRANFGSYIGEVHEPTGETIATLLYTSETPFCWGSGYVLAAVLAHRASSV